MLRSLITAVAFVAVALASTSAWAVSIVKPVPPPGGQITAVTDGLNCNIGNSGHYAIAQGSTLTYQWTVNPQNAATIQPVTSDWHIVRFMSSRSFAQQPGVNYASYTITVFDPGSSPPTATITVYPISLDFVEGQTKDRVVEGPDHGMKDASGNIIHERTIGLDCKGLVAIHTLVSSVYHRVVGSSQNQQNGKGTITETKLDGSAQSVAGGTCTPAGGVQAPYGRWKFTPQGGVTASWSAATQTGTLHTISVRGDVVSSWWNDIEIDVGIEQAPFILNCADGLGASMQYTVAEINLNINEMDETEEEQGDYAFIEKDETEGSWLAGDIERVKPDDCTGYSVRTYVLPPDEDYQQISNVELRLAEENGEPSGSAWQPDRDKAANEALPTSFYGMAKSKSSVRNDVRIRIVLMDQDIEMGGETCRDAASLTVLEAEILNPTKETDGAITTDASGTPPNETGNEYTFSEAADPSADFSLTWRMKVLPNTSEIRNDIDDRMSFQMSSIGDSSATWTDSHNLVYDAQSEQWTSRVTWTRLPSQNSAFGRKWCHVDLASTHGSVNGIALSRTVEVFYPRNAANHQGGVASDPNWFYYWSQIRPNSNITFSSSLSGIAETPAMVQWSYQNSQDKSAIIFGPGALGSGQSYNVGEWLSGVDFFVGTVIHEEKHVSRIAIADALVPVAADTSFRFGWSYNQALINHWDKGADGDWGEQGVDDDGNQIVDDAATVPPFEPGFFDDGRLSGTGRLEDWATAWALPSPDNATFPEESEAVNAEDDGLDENDYADQDWANPGKSHDTTNNWLD